MLRSDRDYATKAVASRSRTKRLAAQAAHIEPRAPAPVQEGPDTPQEEKPDPGALELHPEGDKQDAS
jgi:hypothetical protein